MRTSTLLKYAFEGSVVIYGVIAVAILGGPDWGRPLAPADPFSAILVYALVFMMVVDWVLGSVVCRMAKPPRAFAQLSRGARPWPETGLIIAFAFLEAGAIVGLVLSFLVTDSRYALVSAAVTLVLMLMVPIPPGKTAQEGPPTER